MQYQSMTTLLKDHLAYLTNLHFVMNFRCAKPGRFEFFLNIQYF